MESPAHVQARKSPSREDLGSNCRRSLLSTSDLGAQFIVMDADSAAALDARATANLARDKWLGTRNKISERWGIRRAEAYAACARFKFGDRCLGESRCAADIPSGIAGSRRKFTALALVANLPALFRTGGVETPGAQFGFPRDISTLRR